MRKWIIILLACSGAAGGIQAQSGSWPATLGYEAYSPRGSGHERKNPVDVFSFCVNQGSLGGISTGVLGIYSERKYLLEGLRQVVVACALPVPGGGAGFRASMFGTSDYAENSYGLCYGRMLGSRVGLGVQFNYSAIRVAGYGTAAAIGFEIGTVVHLSDRLTGGMQWKNPTGARFGDGRSEAFPSSFSFGLGYAPSTSFFISGILLKEEGQGTDVNAAIRYSPHKRVDVRIGCATALPLPWLAIGYWLNRLYVEGTASLHPQLGISPALQLQYFIFKHQ